MIKLKPIQKKRVYQEIVEQFINSIKSGNLNPGDKLPSERELAEKLSVSRNAVREAVSVMESAGLVEILQGKGTFLKEDNPAILLQRMDGLIHQSGFDLVELLEVRQGLESQGAYLAACRRTDTDLEKLKKAFEKMEKAYARHETAAEEDFEFHLAVAGAAYNKTLLKTVKLFSNSFIPGAQYLRENSIKTGKSSTVLSEHFEIYQSIKHRDQEKAEKAMRNHLGKAKERYFEYLKINKGV